MGILMLWLACGTGGCSSSHAKSRLRLSDVHQTVESDWDDSDAAVEVALHSCDMAMDHKEVNDNGLERRYYLMTNTDEPAVLIVRRHEAIFDGKQTITIEAHVGRFGDENREAHLIRAVRHRLKVLAGVDYAPVTAPS